MGHRQSKIEHWGAVMARFGESGQEPAAFCRECGIGIRAFRCWRREPGLASSPGEGALELVPLREDPPGEAAGGPAPDGWRDSGVRVEAGGLRIAPGVGLDPASPALAIRVAGGGRREAGHAESPRSRVDLLQPDPGEPAPPVRRAPRPGAPAAGARPADGGLCVFLNRSLRMVKVLCREGDGLSIWSRRLGRGQFSLPRVHAGNIRLETREPQGILAGIRPRRHCRRHSSVVG